MHAVVGLNQTPIKWVCVNTGLGSLLCSSNQSSLWRDQHKEITSVEMCFKSFSVWRECGPLGHQDSEQEDTLCGMARIGSLVQPHATQTGQEAFFPVNKAGRCSVHSQVERETHNIGKTSASVTSCGRICGIFCLLWWWEIVCFGVGGGVV